MTANVTIRPARYEDCEAIARVHVQSWRTTYRGIVPDMVLDTLSVVRRAENWRTTLSSMSQSQGIFVIVAEQGDQIVGFVSGGPERNNDPEYSGEIYAIYLRDDQQGFGTGRHLFNAAVDRLLEAGHRTMLIWALSENPAGGFYRRLGGVPVRTQTVQLGQKMLEETGYGWSDIRALRPATKTNNTNG